MTAPERKAKQIRLMLVDDHPVVLEGLRTMFSNFVEVCVVATCASGEEAHKALSRIEVDVMLVDLRMKPMSGIELIRRVRSSQPQIKALVLSSYELEEEVYQAMQVGAVGYLSKDASAKDLVRAVHSAWEGEEVLSTYLRALMEERKSRRELTPRELQILEMVAKGLTNKEIAGVFGVSQFTVRNQLASISSKLQVSDRTEAARVAIEQGIIIV